MWTHQNFKSQISQGWFGVVHWYWYVRDLRWGVLCRKVWEFEVRSLLRVVVLLGMLGHVPSISWLEISECHHSFCSSRSFLVSHWIVFRSSHCNRSQTCSIMFRSSNSDGHSIIWSLFASINVFTYAMMKGWSSSPNPVWLTVCAAWLCTLFC